MTVGSRPTVPKVSEPQPAARKFLIESDARSVVIEPDNMHEMFQAMEKHEQWAMKPAWYQCLCCCLKPKIPKGMSVNGIQGM